MKFKSLIASLSIIMLVTVPNIAYATDSSSVDKNIETEEISITEENIEEIIVENTKVETEILSKDELDKDNETSENLVLFDEPVLFAAVTPFEPMYFPGDTCDEAPLVALPIIEGLEYLEDRNGDTLTITAVALPGYEIPEGSQNVWVYDMSYGCYVVPFAPMFFPGDTCDEAPTFALPENIEGVEYTTSTDGDIITVTAIAKEGYRFGEGTQTVWTFDMSFGCYVTPIAPTFIPGENPTYNLPTVEGVEYTVVTEGNTITITATPKEGYLFEEGAQTVWVFNTDIELEEITPTEPFLFPLDTCGVTPTIMIPKQVGVIFNQENVPNSSVVIVNATPDDGYKFTLNSITSWTFNLEEKECPPIIPPVYLIEPEIPTLKESTTCNVIPEVTIPIQEGVEYSEEKIDNKSIITATALEGFTFINGTSTKEWEFALNVKPCEVKEITNLDKKDNKEELAKTGSPIILTLLSASILSLLGLGLFRKNKNA